jgi:hypothetical protein
VKVYQYLKRVPEGEMDASCWAMEISFIRRSLKTAIQLDAF